MTVVINMHKTSYVMSWLWRCHVMHNPSSKCYPKTKLWRYFLPWKGYAKYVAYYCTL